MRLSALWLVAGLVAGCGASSEPQAGAVQVYAAASLREAATELAAAFTVRSGIEVELNFAGSNIMAQQILAAPGADVFLSADEEWVLQLVRRGRIDESAVEPFWGNRLVLVARRDSGHQRGDAWILAGAGYRYLAMADPAAVPAGRHARSQLEALERGGESLWQRVAGRLVPALDVRAALALAESDPEILAIVYRTDAATSRRVRILYEFPPDPARPIRYWSARLDDGPSPDGGRRFQRFLSSPEAGALARRFGFTETA